MGPRRLLAVPQRFGNTVVWYRKAFHGFGNSVVLQLTKAFPEC